MELMMGTEGKIALINQVSINSTSIMHLLKY